MGVGVGVGVGVGSILSTAFMIRNDKKEDCLEMTICSPATLCLPLLNAWSFIASVIFTLRLYYLCTEEFVPCIY